jgi:type I restriction enzyme, S subunit
MEEIDFKTFDDNELISYCKENNISYLNKQNKPYARKTLLTNIKNKKTCVNQKEIKIDIDAKLNTIIKSCHDKLYKASISGFKALNDIMNIFILVLLEYVFKSNPEKLNKLIDEKELILKQEEIEEYKSYLLDINCFIAKFEIINNFTSIWRNYIVFLASLFPSLYDKDDTKFNCKEERIIVDIFKTIASLANDINEEFINELAIKHGNIYEYFIGYCGKSENTKAFGQFFTPKPFINAILNDCGFKDMINNLECSNPSLYDPAMGSGGLLGLTYITCKDKINPENIYGCEIEKDTMRYGESSILITTKTFNHNLIRCNTLDRNTNPYLRENKKFDIIISNPPFGTKTNYSDLLPEEERDNKKYKDDIYPIQTTGEKLFIQNIIYLLKEGGICALILPDGELMINKDTNKTIRKFILDHCRLIKIIEVDKGAFKHANIKTKVLILKKEKTDDYNYEIDYLNINKKYEVKLVEKFKLNHNYEFSIKTEDYNDITSENPDVQIKTLGEIFDLIKGTIQSSKIEENINGEGVMVTLSKNILDYKKIKKYTIDGENLFIGNIDSGKKICINYYNGKCDYTNLLLYCKTKEIFKDKIKIKYIYYILINNKENLTLNYLKGLANLSLDIPKFNKLKIPIPSLEIQEEVIKEIEEIDEVIKLKKDANENLKNEKKMLFNNIKLKYLRNSEIKTLGEVCDFQNGKSVTKKDLIEGEYPVIGGGQKPFGYHNKYNVNEDTILCSSSGAYAGYISKYNIKIWASDCFSIISNTNNLNNNYLYHYLLSIQNNIYKLQEGSAQPHIYSSTINKIKIPIPSLEIQEVFVKEVEELNMKMDKIKEDNDYVIKNLEEYKKELFKF